MTQLLSLIATGLMCWYGHMDISGVVLYQALYAQMVMGVNMFLSLYPQLAKGMESMRSLGEVLECPDLEHNIGKQTVHTVSGEIQFKRVGFTYCNRQDHAPEKSKFLGQARSVRGLCRRIGLWQSTAMNLLIGFLR